MSVILALVSIGLFMYPAAVRLARAPFSPQVSGSLASEVQSIDLGDLDAEFQAIDAELNNL